ncbi:SDR family oxidoreductase [Catenulispora sp. NF23]|uniref:SDR family oxidoreductase n=1 Tax=Catenulispora pinistramenti TaxID=2705254 RepID=A0ABS5KRB1_9ACTN|nr:SDR family oxidoreductase [Catenulispora pinistramenti]MBS2533109.1 SDR family oxidoreductase [Catenulispora pinistramenti]MBS2548564.1 SDR family oxidoreductase [Catenulispora pinistramenti]
MTDGRLRRFEGRHVLVTGGGRGIGRVIALAFAAEGATVTVASRTADQIAAVAAELAGTGAKALAVTCDVGVETDVTRLIDTAQQARGPVEILVNCAGTFSLGPSTSFATAQVRELLDTNVLGTFLVTRGVAPGMIERGYGKVVNFASLLSFTAFPQRAAYAASKGGVLQLTRAFALEWARHGINVNAVAPGMIQIETPHPAVAAGTLSEDRIVGRIPAARRGRPADVAGPVLFLCSEDAAYIHGHTLAVDGGWLVNGYV